MSFGNSRAVTSNQTGPHDKLPALLQRYLQNPFRKPISEHTQKAFTEASRWLAAREGELILDSCCGVGESTYYLAQRYPKALVVGIDKSELRVAKSSSQKDIPDNCIVLRGDVIDFWRLALEANWQPTQHFLLYPNPYPKSLHVQQRWQGSPSFIDLLRLGGKLTIRSNWQLYIKECLWALQMCGQNADMMEYYSTTEPMTPFERKYWASGQKSWQVQAMLGALPEAIIECAAPE